MATLYPPHNTNDWSTIGAWSLLDDGLGGQNQPAIGDSVIFTSNSGRIHLDVNSAALANIIMTGYINKLDDLHGVHTLDVDNLGGPTAVFDGTIEGCAIAISGSFEKKGTGIGTAGHEVTITQNAAGAGNPTVKTNGVSSGYDHLVIDNAGVTSFTASEDGGTVIKWASFDTKANSKYAGGAFDHEIAGSLIIDNVMAVFSQTGKWSQTGTGNVKNFCPTRFAHLVLGAGVGVTSTLINHVRCGIYEFGAGAVEGVAVSIYLYANVDNFLISGTGTSSVQVIVLDPDNRSNGEIRLNANFYIYSGFNTKTLTMTGPITLGANDLMIQCGGAGIYTVDMNGHALSCRDVLLGKSTVAAQLGEILYSGATHSIRSMQASNAAAIGNKVDFGTGRIVFTGTILGEQNVGAKITFANTSAVVYDGTVTKCDLSGTNTLYAYGCTDGLGNDNVIFVDTPPGSLLLLGVGL